MNKIFMVLCLTLVMTNAFNLSDFGAIDERINMICSTITTQPALGTSLADRIQQTIKDNQQQMQQRFPRTYPYLVRSENLDKLKAGGDRCKSFFSGLKGPLSADLENNNESQQFMKKLMGHHN